MSGGSLATEVVIRVCTYGSHDTSGSFGVSDRLEVLPGNKPPERPAASGNGRRLFPQHDGQHRSIHSERRITAYCSASTLKHLLPLGTSKGGSSLPGIPCLFGTRLACATHKHVRAEVCGVVGWDIPVPS